MQSCEEAKSKLTTPALFLIGEIDDFVDVDTVKAFHEECAVKDKQLIAYPELDHFLMFDAKHHEQLMTDVTTWMDKRL